VCSVNASHTSCGVAGSSPSHRTSNSSAMPIRLRRLSPRAALHDSFYSNDTRGSPKSTAASPSPPRSSLITLTNVASIDRCISMTVDLELAPKQKRPAGERCCEPVVYPDVEREQAVRMAEVAKALGDPIRLQLVDVLRKHAGKVCVCELVPLFDISQPTLSHHLKKLRAAGIVDSERRGLWAYYYVLPDALKELSEWLS
jgi:ArsR family transcriptional regulator, arsenate/arsenite/antimonite-responsive transcriptional repressor